MHAHARTHAYTAYSNPAAWLALVSNDACVLVYHTVFMNSDLLYEMVQDESIRFIGHNCHRGDYESLRMRGLPIRKDILRQFSDHMGEPLWTLSNGASTSIKRLASVYLYRRVPTSKKVTMRNWDNPHLPTQAARYLATDVCVLADIVNAVQLETGSYGDWF